VGRVPWETRGEDAYKEATNVSLRDRIDPVRVMAVFFGLVFALTIIWLFIQEL
jgi:hypothetical protein